MSPPTLQDTIASALGVGPAPKQKPVWQLIQEDDEYADYEFYVPDVNECGLRLRITRVKEEQTAYMTVIADDVNGRVFAEHSDIALPYAYACRVTNHPLV